jgi:hypothetical protein
LFSGKALAFFEFKPQVAIKEPRQLKVVFGANNCDYLVGIVLLEEFVEFLFHDITCSLSTFADNIFKTKKERG